MTWATRGNNRHDKNDCDNSDRQTDSLDRHRGGSDVFAGVFQPSPIIGNYIFYSLGLITCTVNLPCAPPLRAHAQVSFAPIPTGRPAYVALPASQLFPS